MATTTLQRYVRFGESTIDALDPMDAGLCGRALSNLNHLADQYAQRRVAWVLPAGSTLSPSPTPAVDVWGLVWVSAPFDLHVRADGESYRLRARIRGDSNSGSWAATFRVVVAPYEEVVSQRDVAGANVGDVTFTSASTAWDAPSALLYLDAARVERARGAAPALDSIGGTTREAPWLRCVAAVFGRVNNAGATARLTGLLVDEYMEP